MLAVLAMHRSDIAEYNHPDEQQIPVRFVLYRIISSAELEFLLNDT